MPIDFAAIAAAYQVPLEEQVHLVRPLFDRLHRRLEQLVKHAEGRERTMRAFPLTQWVGGALAVTLTVEQAGALAVEIQPPRGIGDELRASGARFLGELGWIGTAVEQELAIPGVLEVFAEALGAVAASLDRFAVPKPELFDPYSRRFSDVFGAVDMGLRAILESEPELRNYLRGGQHLYSAVLSAWGGKTDTKAAQPLPEKVRGIGELVLEAVLLIPIATQTLEVALRSAAPLVKEALLLQLAALEQELGTVRTHIDPFLRELVIGERGALAWLDAIAFVATIDVRAIGFFADLWLRSVIGGIRHYLNALSDFANEWIAFVNWIHAVLEAVMDFDLAWPASKIPGVPKVTLGKIADLATSEVAMRAFQIAVYGSLSTAAFLSPFKKGQIRALRDVLFALLTPRPFPAETGLFTLPPGGFPDLYWTVFGGHQYARIWIALTNFSSDARTVARYTLRSAAQALDDTSAAFSAAAERTMDTSPERFAQIARRAHEDAVAEFAGPTAEVAAELQARPADPVAEAFEQATARGGLEIVFGAIPAYLGEVRRYWEERAPTATSPHILARHGRLERVRVPRLTIRVPHRRPDAQTRDAIAARWRVAVGEAYLAGVEAAAAA